MALPEDDVEEIDPEPALARILDHEHDAIVVGPGLRPGLATAELVRSLLAVAGEADELDAAPIVLDAEALRSMATMDGWWEGRAPAGRPDPARRASSRGCGPGAATTPPDDGDIVRRRRRPAGGGPRRGRRPGARWSSSRAPGRSSPRPDGSAAIAPFENPALATGGTGDVLAGAIGSLLAQGLTPFDAARLGVYLHGLAGDAVRERFGDAGLLASDLPDGLAIARKRLAAIAERKGAAKRLGFAARGSTTGSTRRPPVRPCAAARRDARRRDGSSADDPSRPMTPVTPRQPIERRLADAGLPPLPRTAWLEIDLDALRDNLAAAARPGRPGRPRPAGGQGRCLRPRRGAGRARARGGRRRRASAWPPSTRRSSCATAASAARSSCSTRSRAAWAAEAARRGHRGRRPATRAGWPRPSARRPRLDPARPLGGRARGRDRPRSRRVRDRRARRRPRALVAALAGRPAGRPVDPLPGRRGRRRSRLPRSTASRPPSRRSRRPGSACRRATSPPARRSSPTACWPTTASGPGWRSTASSPTSSAPAGPPARRRPLRPVMALIARPGPGRGPAGRAGASATGRPSGPPGRAGSRRCRSATATAGRARCRTGPAPSSAAGACRWSGNVAMDAVMADVTDVPGPPVDVADEFVLLGSSGDERISVARPGAGAHHELVGSRDGDVSAPASGVPCRVGAGRSADAHRAERIAWRASSSGTATSATWRSTPS